MRSARLWPYKSIVSQGFCRCITGLCMLHNVHSKPKRCLHGELPQACKSVRLRLTCATVVAQSYLKFRGVEDPRCQTSQFPRRFLPSQAHIWNALNGFKITVLRAYFYDLVLLFSFVQMLPRWIQKFCKRFVFLFEVKSLYTLKYKIINIKLIHI